MQEAWIEHASRTTVRHLQQDVRDARRMRDEAPEAFARTGGVPRRRDDERGRAPGLVPVLACAGASAPADLQTCAPLAPQASPADLQTCVPPTSPPDLQTCVPLPADFRLPTFRQQMSLIRAHLAGSDQGALLDPQAGCILRFSLPQRLEDLWDRACRACRALYGGLPSVADCVQTFLEAYFEGHVVDALETMRRHSILSRDGWRCSVPTCGRRAPLQAHHLHYRSQGGGEEAWNKSCLCRCHHIYGIHTGRIRAHGHAPDDITWELGVGSDGSVHLRVRGRIIVEAACA